MTLYEQLRSKWAASGIAINGGIAPSYLALFEQRWELVLPGAFRAYLLTVDGMTEQQVDDDLMSFLPLERIEEKSDLGEARASHVDLVFADYLVFSHYYLLRTTRGGDTYGVFAEDGTNSKKIANSFEEFISSYLENPTRIAQCW